MLLYSEEVTLRERWYVYASFFCSNDETVLKGVPGTGTRKNGMEGSMLKVNLDGIVLLRFHGEFVVFTFSE